MAGHKIDKQDRAYWKAKPEDLKKHYIAALPYLSLKGVKVKDYGTKEYKELKKENERLQNEIDKLNDKTNNLMDIDTFMNLLGGKSINGLKLPSGEDTINTLKDVFKNRDKNGSS